MIETRRFHCNDCNYFWETTLKVNVSKSCPACNSEKIYRVTGNKRYSRKARPKVRRSVSNYIRR
jgi:Zn finger protein HypA/HybF involved in hydrogenase expression